MAHYLRGSLEDSLAVKAYADMIKKEKGATGGSAARIAWGGGQSNSMKGN